MTDDSLAYCVSALQKAYLIKSPADILGSAFEVMVNPDMKGDKGQYFTPRHVVKMCIDVLQPKDGESVFDIKALRLIQFNYSSADFAA